LRFIPQNPPSSDFAENSLSNWINFRGADQVLAFAYLGAADMSAVVVLPGGVGSYIKLERNRGEKPLLDA
jgi:hypothetical protein